MGMPKRFEFKTPEIEYLRSSQVAALSPVQCPVTLPEPKNVERLMMKGLLWGLKCSRAVRVACASV
tara:strand:+ start:594 stop:791 length:198 start_codon:yes stop_codon:yes gene_type:complete